MVDIVGVSRARTSGSAVTKEGKRQYRGKKKHWYVYFYDNDGRFRKRKINPVEVPYYGSMIRRRKTYQCKGCGERFRATVAKCPNCGAQGATRLASPGKGGAVSPARIDPMPILQNIEAEAAGSIPLHHP